jgi:circadian clock protein KaiC
MDRKNHKTQKNGKLGQNDFFIPKVKTGIKGFEHISVGGIPKGRTTLLAGTSGSGKTLFGLEFLWRGIVDCKEGAVFVTFEETSEDIIRNVKSLGWRLDIMIKQGKLAIVDASPSLEDIGVIGQYDFMALLARLEHAIRKTNAKRLVLDSISALFPRYGDEGIVRRELFRVGARLKAMGITTILTGERIGEYGAVARFGVEEFVSDNVMIVRNILDEEKRRRTIEILKFRGTLHQKGEYPFTISRDGINILPLSAIELKQRSSTVRISSGNEALDKMCGGGFFRDSIILVSGATGTGKTLLTTTYAADACKRGKRAIIFAFEESREQLTRNATAWGMDYEKWEKQGLLKIVCQYPEVMGLEDHLLKIRNAVEEFKPQRLAMDSLSAMERVSTVKAFREFVIGLTSHIKHLEIAGLFTNTTASLMGGESITETHVSTITDSIVVLRYVELHGEMQRGIAVLKMRGSMHDKAIHEYHIDSKGIHIGGTFKGVENIMTGTPRAALKAEREQLSSILSPRES